jgi:hypothetical protein
MSFSGKSTELEIIMLTVSLTNTSITCFLHVWELGGNKKGHESKRETIKSVEGEVKWG